MFDQLNIQDMILLILPLAVLQYGLAAYCIVKIVREGVANLTRWAWILICLFANLVGPLTFLLIGRRRDAS